MNKLAQSYRDLEVYQKAFGFQQEIFSISKQWPIEEKYSLIDQIRRSSRSIGANLAEAWAKRRYSAHFLSKLTDADGELQETDHWINTAFACGYLDENQRGHLATMQEIVGKKLGGMMANHESFCSHH